MVMFSRIVFWYGFALRFLFVRLLLKLMNKFNEEKEYEGIRAIKIFDFENTRSLGKTENKMLDKSYISTRGMYLQKLPLLFTLQMNQSFSAIFHL